MIRVSIFIVELTKKVLNRPKKIHNLKQSAPNVMKQINVSWARKKNVNRKLRLNQRNQQFISRQNITFRIIVHTVCYLDIRAVSTVEKEETKIDPVKANQRTTSSKKKTKRKKPQTQKDFMKKRKFVEKGNVGLYVHQPFKCNLFYILYMIAL